ncbi:hypothetical protein F4553_002825 [Allocatelliglobosispora scoriae]|uniref:Uncharacterized protein n=1 Tax=Allocatelliglobosispora scoriae TaxID=643052 RepID=A0A841BQ65_9ACTN|nr:hypothetical protein [Allocatelliglobosispora scoriae]MBB5869446.1 hypothetical protein [Allocatelliglobosispora scoriae]
MFSGDPGTARQEAERLVVAALAAATLAANAHPDLATGSPACCVCPFCKVIEAVRDPDPEFVERLATGAGDLAVGIAGLMRNLATPKTDGEPADVWRAATTTPPHEAAQPGDDTPPKPAKKIAKKAIRKVVPKDPSTTVTTGPEQGLKQVPKKAVHKISLPDPE